MKKKIILILSIIFIIISITLFTYILIDNNNLKNKIDQRSNDKMAIQNNINLNESEITKIKETLEQKSKEKEFEVKVYEVWKKNNENVLNYLK